MRDYGDVLTLEEQFDKVMAKSMKENRKRLPAKFEDEGGHPLSEKQAEYGQWLRDTTEGN